MHMNLRRYDLSDRLIHFTRPVKHWGGSAPGEFPTEWGFGEIVEEDELSPFFLLRRILRKRQILSTWSCRRGRRTIYGPHPAVCFTEMPLAAFLETSAIRSAKGEKMSSYAVLLHKEHVFAVGARPVIYGLSAKATAAAGRNGARQLSRTALPSKEQYRFVAFDATKNGKLDWTHEREWRWPNRGYKSFKPYEVYAKGTLGRKWSDDRDRDRADSDGLNLDRLPFRDIGFLVKNGRQAQLLLHDILQMVDRREIDEQLFTFILRLDSLPSKLVDPKRAAKAIAAGAIDLSPYLSMPQPTARALTVRLRSLTAKYARMKKSDNSGEIGNCWLWLHDNTHPLVRALVQRNDIVISRQGRYLVEIFEFDESMSLSSRQHAVQRLVKATTKEFGTAASYFSVLGSDDPDGVPFYTDTDGVWQPIQGNFAHVPDDF